MDPLNLAIGNVRKAHLKDAAIKDGRARLEALFGTQGFNTVIVSNESAYGDPFKDGVPGFFPLLAPATEGLKQMFAGYKLVPIFFVRDQATLLPSFYGQRVRKGASDSFREFAARAQRLDLSWQPVITAIAEAFPKAQLQIHRVEDFTKEPEDYAAALFAPFVQGLRLEAASTAAKNKAAKSYALAMMLMVNRLIDRLVFLRKDNRFALKKKIRRIVFPIFECIKFGDKLILSDDHAADLKRIYQKDIKALPVKKGPVQENRP